MTFKSLSKFTVRAILGVAFWACHYLLVDQQVPLQNVIPASLGASALTAMTLCIVMAAKIPFIERFTKGSGYTYRIHRQLSYIALVATLIHWLTASPRGEGLVPQWAEFAGVSGKYAVVALLVLMAVSVFRVIPYHWWRSTHLLVVPVFLLVVFHTFFAAVPVASYSVLWWELIAISGTGLAALFWILLRYFLPRKMLIVASIDHVGNGMDVRLKKVGRGAPPTWRPGQFATIYIDKPGLREPHPFTICSDPRSAEMRFLIANAGDYTRRLASKLRVGDQIRISGIDGQLRPQFSKYRTQRQIWLAGGFGVTPFLSAIDAMEPDQSPQIDLFYCFKSLEQALDVERLIGCAERLPQLVVHFLGSREGARFSETTFGDCLTGNWRDAELFLCGPDLLMEKGIKSYRASGGCGNIHRELVDFRGGISFLSSKSSMPVSRRQDNLAAYEEKHFQNFGIKTFGLPDQ